MWWQKNCCVMPSEGGQAGGPRSEMGELLLWAYWRDQTLICVIQSRALQCLVVPFDNLQQRSRLLLFFYTSKYVSIPSLGWSTCHVKRHQSSLGAKCTAA